MESASTHQDRSAILTEIVLRNSGVHAADLSPDVRVSDLGVDSISAAEILSQAEEELGVEIDYAGLLQDWSTLTVGQLVTQLLQGAALSPRID